MNRCDASEDSLSLCVPPGDKTLHRTPHTSPGFQEPVNGSVNASLDVWFRHETRFKAVRRTSDVSFRAPCPPRQDLQRTGQGKKNSSCSAFNERTWSGVSLKRRMMSLQTVTNGRTSTFWFTAEHLSRVLHPDRNQHRFYISPPETTFTFFYLNYL